MSFLLHELMELVLLISAIAVTWAVPRPAWISRLYNRIGRAFGRNPQYKYFYINFLGVDLGLFPGFLFSVCLFVSA